MIHYELKKIYSKGSSKAALLVLFAVLCVTCYFAANVSYVNENGITVKGPSAAQSLRAARKQWSGPLDEEKIRRVIAENLRIRNTPEAHSEIDRDREIAYSWGQGIQEIRDLLNASYATGFRDHDYYRADSLTEEDADRFYENRISLMQEWLEDEAKDQFSQAEKDYLLRQYASLSTPFYYDYMAGWSRLFEFAPTIVMITMLILGYLTAGIFSNEFTWKSDAVFFTARYGRDRAILAKIKAGFLVVTALYFAAFLLYTGAVLLYLGADGWNCPVQADWISWKCFYSITIWQKYLLILLGGYVGCLFLSFLTMLVSARTKSSVLAVMVPVVVVFLPSFLGNISHPIISKIICLLPYQLLETGTVLNYFHFYSFAGRIFGAVPVLLVLYGVLTLLLPPVLYRVYRHQQIH